MRAIELLGLNFLFMGQSLYKTQDIKTVSIIFLISQKYPLCFSSLCWLPLVPIWRDTEELEICGDRV